MTLSKIICPVFGDNRSSFILSFDEMVENSQRAEVVGPVNRNCRNKISERVPEIKIFPGGNLNSPGPVESHGRDKRSENMKRSTDDPSESQQNHTSVLRQRAEIKITVNKVLQNSEGKSAHYPRNKEFRGITDHPRFFLQNPQHSGLFQNFLKKRCKKNQKHQTLNA